MATYGNDTITGLAAGGLPDDSITNAEIADDAVQAAQIADDAVVAAAIADDAVVQAAIADEAVDEARLQISNAGSNGEFLSKQSGNTGGLTWAAAGGGTVKKYFYYQDDDVFYTSSSDWQDTNFESGAFVPTASSGTSLLLQFDLAVYCSPGTATYEAKPRHRFPLKILRKIDSGDWTSIKEYGADAAGGGYIFGIDFNNDDTDMIGLIGYSTITLKDNPATTGSVYYKLQIKRGLTGMDSALSRGANTYFTILEVED